MAGLCPGAPEIEALSDKSTGPKLIAQKVCQFPHKSVNFSVIITNVKNHLTDLCGNRILQNDLINALCEIKTNRTLHFGGWVDNMRFRFGDVGVIRKQGHSLLAEQPQAHVHEHVMALPHSS